MPQLALRWATSLGAGLGLCRRWPFAVVLLWLPGERGNPVRRVRAPVSAPEGGNGALPAPSPPSMQGRAFSPAPAAVCLLLAPGQRDPLYSGRVTAFVPVPPLKRFSVSRPLYPPHRAGAGLMLSSPAQRVGMAPQQVGCTELAPSSGTVFPSPVFPSPVFPLVGVSEQACLCFWPPLDTEQCSLDFPGGKEELCAATGRSPKTHGWRNCPALPLLSEDGAKPLSGSVGTVTRP